MFLLTNANLLQNFGEKTSTVLSKLLSKCHGDPFKKQSFFGETSIFFIFFGSRAEIVGKFAIKISAGLSKMQSTCRPKPFEAFVFLRKQYNFIYFRIFRKTSLNFWRSNIGRVVRNTLYVSRGRF